MMSPQKFERISGHQPVTERRGDRWLAECACACGKDVLRLASGWQPSASKALEILREMVLNEHRFICLDRANWKCEGCGGIRGLSAHHRIFRSHGRDDRVENLEAACADCHAQEHGG